MNAAVTARRILLVEDNTITRRLLGSLLERAGCVVLEAVDGASALRLAERVRVDLVLQDLGLPDMDGFDLARRLRRLPALARVPIVACSSFVSSLDRAEMAALGFDDFLLKPVEPALLLETLEWNLGAGGHASGRGASRRVLVVEDDEVQAKLLRFVLIHEGFEVASAANGKEGFEAALVRPPDVVATDALMPAVDGFELCAMIRREERLRGIPVVLYSSLDLDEQARRLAQNAGASVIVPRTPDFRPVVDAILSALAAGPAAMPEPVETPLDEQIRHVIGQLKQQLARNAELDRRLSTQSATMSVLSGIADVVGKRGDAVLAPDTILHQCLDAAGLPMGALYLLDNRGQLTVSAVSGYRPASGVDDLFGHAVLLAEASRGGEPISVPGPSLSPEAASDFLGRSAGTSALVVPLMAGGECSGVLLMVSDWKNLSESHWLTFARTLSVTLGQTLRLTRRHAEAQALARLARDLTATLDVSEVAARIIEGVMPLLSVRSAGFRLLEADGSLLSIAADPSGALAPAGARLAPGQGFSGRAVAEGRAVWSGDALAEGVLAIDDPTRARAAASGLHAHLAVPLHVKGRIIGALAVADVRGRVFDEAQVALLQTFADQAALAVENARHHEEARRGRHEAEVMADLLAKISGSRNLDAVLQRVTDGARELCGADWSAIALRARDANALVVHHVRGEGEAAAVETRIDAERGAAGWVLDTGRPFRSDNCAADPRLAAENVSGATPAVAALVIPITAEKRTEGLLLVEHRSSRTFSAHDEAVLLRLVDYAALAIRNAREQETLEQQEKLASMGELLAGVAHELNNPLAVMLGHLQILQQGIASPHAERIAKIRKAGERCTRIVRNFIALARRRSPQRERLALAPVMNEALELLAYSLKIDNVTVEVDCAESLPMLWADPHEIHQVLINLITNAHYAMREQSGPRRLTVTARPDQAGRHVILHVRDTGPGVPPGVRARVFEPFFTTKPVGQGTGLGLPLCKSIVENHGGTIELESEPGKGTAFRICLPVADGAASEAREAPGPAATAPRSILVVDDEREVADVLRDMLMADGHQVDVAVDGIEALKRIGSHTYDLVFSDLKMPRLDGPGLYRAAGQCSAGRPPFVFVTGDMLGPETGSFLDTAGVPCIDKPFTLDDVRRILLAVPAGTASVACL